MKKKHDLHSQGVDGLIVEHVTQSRMKSGLENAGRTKRISDWETRQGFLKNVASAQSIKG